MKKVNILIMAALFGVMSLTACGSGDDGSGGEFNVVISSNPGNLDPQLAEDKESFMLSATFTAPLWILMAAA